MTEERTSEIVRRRYAEFATAAAQGATCCTPEEKTVFGAGRYGEEDLNVLPATAAAASLGCGNPTAVADLADGDVVLDLGSGGGIDVILSARRVGPTGRAIGLDMTDEMLALAVRNAAEAGVENVEFVRGTMESIPLPSGSVDVVISNCVINLAADKAAVLSEIARVLRPGGRVGVSDVVADDSLSPSERAERGSFSGCIAGALSFSEYRTGLAAVGLTEISIEPTHAVADGLHGAIVKATKPLQPTAVDDRPAMPVLPRAITVLETGGEACGCGSGGCC